jgi:chromosome partitioning protein
VKRTKIIVVINQKGGVGKSTLAFNLAYAPLLKKPKTRVLCLDLDSQGNLSQYLTGDLGVIDDTLGGVGLFLEGKPFVPSKTSHPQIDLLHGHKKLDRYDNDADVETRGYGPEMQATLRGLGYDYVIIDTPPAVGFRHLAALCWADIAVIPMEPVMSAIGGFQNVIEAIDTMITEMNPTLRWFGVMNRVNMRVRSHREKVAFVYETYGNRILATLSTRTAVSDAMEEEPALPVWSCRSAPKALRDDWRDFCERVIGK